MNKRLTNRDYKCEDCGNVLIISQLRVNQGIVPRLGVSCSIKRFKEGKKLLGLRDIIPEPQPSI